MKNLNAENEQIVFVNFRFRKDLIDGNEQIVRSCIIVLNK